MYFLNKVQVNCLIKRGSLRVQEGKDDASTADFEAAISHDPDNSDIYHHRGQVQIVFSLSFMWHNKLWAVTNSLINKFCIVGNDTVGVYCKVSFLILFA